MVSDLIRAVNHFTGKLEQPIKFEILATGAAVNVDLLMDFGFMRMGG